MSPPQLRMTALEVRRDDRNILGPLDLTIAPGEFVTIVGPNGAGKSTLLGVIGGWIAPTQGSVVPSWDGVRRPATLLQHHDFVPSIPFSALDVVSFGRPDGRPGEETSRAMALTRVGHLARCPYRNLSGGERRRVQLARLVAQESPVMLLDEPSSGLDPSAHEELLKLLDLLHGRTGATMVLVSHHLDRVPAGCRQMVLLHHGTILASGPVPEVFTEANLSRLYGTPMVVVERGGQRGAMALPPEPSPPPSAVERT